MGILVDMSGDTCEDCAKGLDRVVNVLDWDINDVDSTTQEVNWHRHMTWLISWLLIATTRIWKVEPLANKVTRTKEIEVWYQ